MVKVNGTPINLETVIKRFQTEPNRMMKYPWFQPSDCVTKEELWERGLSLGKEAIRLREIGEIPEHSDCCEGWFIDSMGWRFLYWQDAWGEVEPICYAPLTGKLEIVKDRGVKAIEYALDHGLPLE